MVELDARTIEVLRRFPRHLAADEPGKVLGALASVFVRELDVKTVQVGRVRKAHRLLQVDEARDLLRLADLHAIDVESFELLVERLAALGSAKEVLASPSSSQDAVDAALARVRELLGLDTARVPFAPRASEGTDLAPARARLVRSLVDLLTHERSLELRRARVQAIVALFRMGNGTVGALLGAAAACLDLERSGALTRSPDGYWHLVPVVDRLRLVREDDAPSPGQPVGRSEVVPEREWIALEENPEQLQDIQPVERRHGAVFTVMRAGFEIPRTTVRVLGVGDRTIHPMVVNVGRGEGVAYFGAVADGAELRFTSDGRATLDGQDVSQRAFSFSGGVFADEASPHESDFVFGDESNPSAGGDRTLTFSVTKPLSDRFAPDALWPHAGGILETPMIELGESRWALFVRDAHFGADADPPRTSLPTHAISEYSAGIFDGAVFAAEGGGVGAASAKVGLEWIDREAFALTIWIPSRFASLDVPERVTAAERLRLELDRHRAAGVHVYVNYQSERWVLGEGIVRSSSSDDPLGTLIRGSRVWPESPR